MTDQPARPAALSDSEIIAETFQAIRVQEFKNVDQVKQLMKERFPDVSETRRHECLVKLANLLVEANQELLTNEQRKGWSRRPR